MTVATHTEPFKVPFGQVSVNKGRITGYQEKPMLPVVLSSGIYVLAKSVLSNIPHARAVGAHEVVKMLLGEDQKIVAFEHSFPWVDVNDAASVERAEDLIMANFRSFELRRTSPDRHVAIVCVLCDGAVAVPKSSSSLSPVGGLPAVEIAKSERPERAINRCGLGSSIRPESGQVLVSFDDIDARTGECIRHHVVLAEPTASSQATHGNPALEWIQKHELLTMFSDSRNNYRTLSYLKRHAANSHSLGN